MKYADIDQFPHSCYHINVALHQVKMTLEMFDHPQVGAPLILNPDFQRGHVWTTAQQISFMEYFLRGGKMGRDIYFNCSTWNKHVKTPVYCVDGLQRLTAALAFVDNKIKVFGHYEKEYTDSPRMVLVNFSFHMLAIEKKRELLKIYLNFNSAGVKHSKKELDKVTKMIEDTPEDELL